MGLVVALLMALGFAIGAAFWGGYSGGIGLLGVFGVGAIVWSLVGYYSGDKMVIAVSGAHQVTHEDEPQLFNVVEEMTIAAGLPRVPSVYVIEEPAPNAFATGRDPQHASVAVTTGLLSMMKREELEGVVAHEISHIGNYDIRFAMIAVVFAGAVALLGEFAWRFMAFGGRGRREDRGGGGALVLIALVFVILTPIFAQIVRFALSREREYLADANGARMTRYPEGLASALEKIKKASIPTAAASDTTASLYFSNPFPNKFGFLGSTHPSIDARIKRLREM
jgi:heat shock protein HtpX